MHYASYSVNVVPRNETAENHLHSMMLHMNQMCESKVVPSVVWIYHQTPNLRVTPMDNQRCRKHKTSVSLLSSSTSTQLLRTSDPLTRQNKCTIMLQSARLLIRLEFFASLGMKPLGWWASFLANPEPVNASDGIKDECLVITGSLARLKRHTSFHITSPTSSVMSILN